MKLFDWIKLPKMFGGGPTENPNKPVSTTRLARRGSSLPMFTDLPTQVERGAYDVIYEHDATFSPMFKRACKVGMFVPVVIGEGPRRDEMQEIVDNCIGMSEILEHLSYADLEGVMFAWLRSQALPDSKMNVVNFMGCGERKINAGGNYWWGGVDYPKMVRLEPLSNGNSDDESLTLDPKRVVVFCPSATPNPDGDTRMALNMLRIASQAAVLDQAEHVYTERHSLPKEIIELVMKEFDPSIVQTALVSAGAALRDSHALDNLAMSPDEVMKLVETNGKTWQFLMELRKSLNGRAHKLVTGENMTTETEGGGDSELAEKQFFSRAAYILKKMADPLTTVFLPFCAEINKHWMTPRKVKDKPMYLEFRPAIEKHRLSVSELNASADRNIPMLWEDVYAVLGMTMPEGIKEKFGDYYLKSNMEPEKKENLPLPTDGPGMQRSDREQKDSDVPDEHTRKQDPKEDMRNVGENTDE
jgi:hypothetical protein